MHLNDSRDAFGSGADRHANVGDGTIDPDVLVGACATTLDFAWALRLRVAIIAALGTIGYCIAVFLIFFLVWTPADWDQIEGVQGRYFIVALPALAITAAALMRRGLPIGWNAFAALAAAAISAGAIVEAVLRVDWRW